MRSQNQPCENLRSLAGLAMAGMGLFLLFGHVAGVADQLRHLLDQTTAAGLGLVSSIMLASSWNPHRLMLDLLSLLWPTVLLAAGMVLAGSTSVEQNSRPHGPCVRWAFR